MVLTTARLFYRMTIILCFAATALTSNVKRECNKDLDCVKEGKLFCHDFQCTSCVPCSTLNRQPPVKSADGNQCAVTAESCGPCSPGYQPEEIKGPLRFLMRTYRCEKANGASFRIEVLFGSLMLVAVAIVLGILFKVWRDSKSKRISKQGIVDTDSIELVHTSRGYENPISSETELARHSSGSSKEGISTGSYEAHESPISQGSNSVRMSNTNLIIVPAEQEGLVQAVPIGPYHVPNADATLAEAALSPSAGGIRPATESNNWVWRSDSVSSSELDPSREHLVTATLVRCHSQDNLAQSCATVGKRVTSDPLLCNQNGYANVHVSLNTHRTAPNHCVATSDGMLIDEHHAKAASFNSAPNIARSYQPIYPPLAATPVVEMSQNTDAREAQIVSDDKVEELSEHVFLSSEDTITKSARSSAYIPNERIAKSTTKTESQPLPTSAIECTLKHSQSCPRLTDAK